MHSTHVFIRQVVRNIALVTLVGLSTNAYIAATPEEAANRLHTFLQGFPDRGPGFSVVAVTADKTLLKYVDGLRNTSSGKPLTADTPIYIASQTKAYMGLLASHLDAKGILKLDSKITDHWPDVKFPEGIDAGDYSLADLLNHNVPIDVGLITFIEACVTELDYRKYPELIEKHASARDAGFEYDNVGYNIYSAILHTATGKSWQEWLQQEIFTPMGLKYTSAKTSDFTLDQLSWNHIWQGEDKGWHLVKPKTDEMMQSAGGMVTTANDMITWLQFQLAKGKNQRHISPAAITRAQTIGVEIERNARNAYELPCYGYALGWNVCDFEGHTLYIHGGGYTGARTMMAFSPDLGVGIGVFSNSDNMTGWLTSRTIVMFLQYLIEHEDAEKWTEVRQRIYPQRIAKLLSHRNKQLKDSREQQAFADWSWTPSVTELKQFTGQYHTEGYDLTVTVTQQQDQLLLQLHSYRASLYPAAKDVFAEQSVALERYDVVQFLRNEEGNIESFTWEGLTFNKL